MSIKSVNHVAVAEGDKGAYFLMGEFWLCRNMTPNGKPNPCDTPVFKGNTLPGESLYSLDPGGYKFEIYIGSWQSRIEAKKQDSGDWENVERFV